MQPASGMAFIKELTGAPAEPVTEMKSLLPPTFPRPRPFGGFYHFFTFIEKMWQR